MNMMMMDMMMMDMMMMNIDDGDDEHYDDYALQG